MKDIHSHILPGIDDGSISVENSLNLIKHLSSIGTTDLVLTPHYIYDTKFICDNTKKTELFENLKSLVKENNININLYLGNEIFINDNIIDLLNDNKITTINNTKYLLVEFPLYEDEVKYLDIIDTLQSKGYKIILAHPERYYFVQKDYTLLEEYIEKGVLLQGNATSLYGKYGSSSKSTLKNLIKMGYISFLASDTHRHNIEYTEKDLIKKLQWYTSMSNIKKMLNTNFDKVINNEDI